MFTALKHLGARLRAFFSSRDLDDDFEQELESHLTMLTEDNVRRGLTPEQARRAALIRIGGPASIQEQHRAARGLPAVEAVLQDLRFAFRLIAKGRGLSAAAIVALSLGIGANTVGFTIVNAAFFRGLPFEDSDRLYTLCWQNRSGRRSSVSHTELEDWRARSRSFASFAAYSDATMNMALHVSKINNNDVLKEGGRGSMGNRRMRWFSSTLVVAELALTVVLLSGAGLMIRSFMTLYSVDIGTSLDDLLTMRLQLPGSKYPNADARRAFFERLEPRLAAIPGIEAAAVTTGVPGRDGGERLLEIDGPAGTAEARPVNVSTVTMSPRFFEVVGVPLVRGRNFHDRDGTAGSETVIINEDLAARFFPGADPIGRRLRFTEREPTPGRPPDLWRTIVGISGRILHGSSLDSYENAVVYIPYRQELPAATSLLVRSALPPGAVMDAVRREVQAIDQDQPVFAIQTLGQLLTEDRWWYRTWGGMFGIVAVIALVLSSVGLYAVMAYSVTERTQEIGLRMAVGAQRWQVSWLILKRGLVQLAMGLTVGLAGALALSRMLRLGLADIGPNDPVTFAAITVLLTVVSIAACLLPARRATRVDPVVALRAE